MLRAPGMMARLSRSFTVALRGRLGSAMVGLDASGMSSAIWNWYHAAFLLASVTVHSMVASAAVSSFTTSPAAL
jgi:hypothetical protein